MKKVLLTVGFIFIVVSVYSSGNRNIAPEVKDLLTNGLSDSLVVIPEQIKKSNPSSKILRGNEEVPLRKEITIEDIDKTMSELVSKLPEEQRRTIRKSNGELYDYIPPASLKEPKKKVKKRTILEIKSVNDLSALAKESGKVSSENIRVVQYNNGNSSTSSGNSKIVMANDKMIVLSDDVKQPEDILNYLAYTDMISDNKDANGYGNSSNFLDHFSIAVGASTTGFRLDYGATISRNVDFRIGFSYLDFDCDFDVGLNDEAIRGATLGNYDPRLDFNADMKYSNLHAMFDFYPMRNGIFHITAGLFFGRNKIKVEGSLMDNQTGDIAVLRPELDRWPALYYGDYEIPIQNDGTFNVDIRTGKDWVKPYLGAGLGRSVPKGNFGFKLEAGLMYQGSFTMEQDGVELKKIKDKPTSFNDGNYDKFLKWWPVVNLQLVYRFK